MAMKKVCEVICQVRKNVTNTEMLVKDFIKHGCCGSIFTVLFFHSF